MYRKKMISQTVAVILSIILLTISLFPFYYMFIQSLMDWSIVDTQFFSTNLSFKSYTYLFGTGGSGTNIWLRALLNSLIVTIPTAVISVIVGLFMGYASTKMVFNGKKFILNTLLFQMFFPGIILLVPRYILIKPLVNTYSGMILPMCISVWAIFMYINFFKTLPDSVFEAAKIDGASDIKIVTKFGLPLTKSISTIVFLTVFMGRWSELMWDMLVAPDVKMQTLNVMISNQFKPMGNYPGPMYAASVVLTFPIILLFLAFSKHFKDGINFMLK